MKKRTTHTFSIDDELYEIFMKIIKDKKINKSRLVESFIEEYISKSENFK